MVTRLLMSPNTRGGSLEVAWDIHSKDKDQAAKMPLRPEIVQALPFSLDQQQTNRLLRSSEGI